MDIKGKKILLTNIALRDYAGSEINCLNLAEALNARGAEVAIATFHYEDPIRKEFEKNSFQVKDLLSDEVEWDHFDLIWAHHAPVLDCLLFAKNVTADRILYSSLSPFEGLEAAPVYADELALILANSAETARQLQIEGCRKETITVFPNYITESVLNLPVHKAPAIPSRVAVISNHIPPEVDAAAKLLREQNITVDFFGLGHRQELVTGKLLSEYDAIITIGKTVPWCLALQIPVFCYDVHGGPGWLSANNAEKSFEYNFSGRPFHKKNEQELANEFIIGYEDSIKETAFLHDFVLSRCNLTQNLDRVLEAVFSSKKTDVNSILDNYAVKFRENKYVKRFFFEGLEKQREIEKMKAESDLLIDRYTKAIEDKTQIALWLKSREKQLEEAQETIRKRENELLAVCSAHEEEMQSVRAAHEGEMQSVRAAHEEEMQSAHSAHKEEMQSVQIAYEKQVNRLKRETETIKLQQERAEKQYRDTLDRKDQELSLIYSSKAWKLVCFYRKIKDSIIALFSKKKIKTKEITQKSAPESYKDTTDFLEWQERRQIDIIATPHTSFIANSLSRMLHGCGRECTVYTAQPEQYGEHAYILICPLFLTELPKNYAVFQMEQTVNSRWLTERYMEILNGAYAILDYSLVNIEYFCSQPQLTQKIFYLPIDVDREMLRKMRLSEEKPYDVLFYGDNHNERRGAMLQTLQQRFHVKIINNLFGEELYQELRKAKIIVNIHYYEGALLETTRIYEVLSNIDALIVSERSTDGTEDEKLNDIVDFVDTDDMDALCERISYWLENEKERESRVRKNADLLAGKANEEEFYFHRFLLANDTISFDEFYEKCADFIHLPGNRVCLSLPESIDRRREFNEDNHYGFWCFPGLRHSLGWIGCAMSYKFLFRKAMEQKLSSVLICEDDVFFPPDFSDRFSVMLDYLNQSEQWQIFSGIISDVGDVDVMDVQDFKTETVVTIDHMVSMVFNIYRESVFPLIAGWDEKNRDVNINTVDRYLERNTLQIVTTSPFLVGHKENLHSTIWGGQNTIYSDMISRSSEKLQELVCKYLSEKNSMK